MKGRKVVNERRHSRRWVYGLHVVERRLAQRPQDLLQVWTCASGEGHRKIVQQAQASGIACQNVDPQTLLRAVGNSVHQGIIAETRPFPYAEIADLRGRQGNLLALDQMQDPHNLGALIRTAVAAGFAGILLPRHGTVEVTPAVEKVAAGTALEIPIVMVANLSRALSKLKDEGYWLVALSTRGGLNLFTLDAPRPAVLVLGGEAGLRPLVEAQCDFHATIPMAPAAESLNASVAGAIAMYALNHSG